MVVLKSHQKNAPDLFNELSENRDKTLMVELSAAKGSKKSISQLLNLCRCQLKEAEERLLVRIFLQRN